MKAVSLEIKYRDFDVFLVVHNREKIRRWTVGSGEYERNLFASYLFRGTMYEYREDDNSPVDIYKGEKFFNTDITWNFSTYEHFDDDTTWLCFSSMKPMNAIYVKLDGTLTVPNGCGVYCVLGSFETVIDNNIVIAKSLNYVKPRDSLVIQGNAKILLISFGNFVNKPKVLDY